MPNTEPHILVESVSHTDPQGAEQEIESPYAVVSATVERVERLSPSFARVTFVGPGVDTIGTPGHTFDQRIKIIFPSQSGALPDLSNTGDEWYQVWLQTDECERGSIRTYSIRDLNVEGGRTRVVVDFVLHASGGSLGPAARWVETAQVNDTVVLVAPRRGRLDGGGIEFHPAATQTVLLAGDETAAPAIARILEDADPSTRGVAFIEVPASDDELHISAPPGIDLHWLVRGDLAHGARLMPAVLEYLGTRTNDVEPEEPAEDLVWETPDFSGLGESIEHVSESVTVNDATPGNEASLSSVQSEPAPADHYFWIAGESSVVTTLRRHLVRGLGVARSQVAFMGYWRLGVAMKN